MRSLSARGGATPRGLAPSSRPVSRGGTRRVPPPPSRSPRPARANSQLAALIGGPDWPPHSRFLARTAILKILLILGSGGRCTRITPDRGPRAFSSAPAVASVASLCSRAPGPRRPGPAVSAASGQGGREGAAGPARFAAAIWTAAWGGGGDAARPAVGGAAGPSGFPRRGYPDRGAEREGSPPGRRSGSVPAAGGGNSEVGFSRGPRLPGL